MGQVRPFALELLQVHAARPDDLFYGTEVLGGLFRFKELERLDAAYRELGNAGLMDQTDVVISYFGETKNLYRLTVKGAAAVKQSVPA